MSESPPKLPAIQAGAQVRAIVPNDFESAWRIANAVIKSGVAPYGVDTAEKAMVIIMHGLEVGMTPMMALQSIALINKRPSVYGDGALGLVRASGLLESFEETIIDKDNDIVAVCRVKRRGESTIIERSFSKTDAERAHLWNKKGKDGQETPWQTYPKRMLTMRARAFALRDGFADVLRGLAIKEEADDILMRDVSPDDGPPAPPQSRIAHESTVESDVALVESGLDDGQQVIWDDEKSQEVA